MNILLLIIILAFASLAWWRFEYGIVALFSALPLYLIRFPFGPIPTTVFEMLLLLFVGIGIVQYKSTILTTIKKYYKEYTTLCWGIILFIIGATIGVSQSTDTIAALGEWKAFYIEPLLLVAVLAAAQTDIDIKRRTLQGLTYSTVAVVLFIIFQVLAGGIYVPAGFWQPDGSYRATAWYGFPNGVGILLGLCFFPVLAYIKSYTRRKKLYALAFVLGALFAIVAAKSTGAIIGVTAGIGILLLTHARTRVPAIIAGSIGLVIFLLLPMNNPIKYEVLLQDRSGQIRVHIWKETIELLKDRPLVGSGMASYSQRIEPYHTTVNGETIEIFHHPHNIFLTLWMNTGIVGLIGFILIVVSAVRTSIKAKSWYMLAAIAALLVMGLVDSPYIKNDWAVIMWGVLLLSFSTQTKKHP